MDRNVRNGIKFQQKVNINHALLIKWKAFCRIAEGFFYHNLIALTKKN
jgi:hypothetical protein